MRLLWTHAKQRQVIWSDLIWQKHQKKRLAKKQCERAARFSSNTASPDNSVWMCLAWDSDTKHSKLQQDLMCRRRLYTMCSNAISTSWVASENFRNKPGAEHSQNQKKYRDEDRYGSINEDQFNMDQKHIMVLLFVCSRAQSGCQLFTCFPNCLPAFSVVCLRGWLTSWSNKYERIINFDCWLNWLLDWFDFLRDLLFGCVQSDNLSIETLIRVLWIDP